MRTQQKSILVLAIITTFVATVLLLPGLVGAGDLEPSASPDDPGSAMYTIEDIYNYLDTGVAGAKRTVGFVDPTSSPCPTGHTFDDVHAKIGERCITCDGVLSDEGRWCDNENGTVTDMTTGLVWLKNASWGCQYAFWVSSMGGTNAHDRAAQLKAGVGGLTDDSVEGDWRLPTETELYNLANGDEAVRSFDMQAFTGVQSYGYWSSTTYAGNTHYAWDVYLSIGTVGYALKDYDYYVWPVRSDN